MSTLLTVSHLIKHFPAAGGKFVRAVDDVSFDIAAGETVALVGESGCGKSTTGRLILRLIEPTGGEIQFEGSDVLRLKREALQAYRRQVQIIFQDPFNSLNPRMTVQQIIAEPLLVHHMGSREPIPSRVVELLELVGLSAAHLHRYPHEFSGGQRQRIGIARALALSPKLIICDEPVSSLDVSVQAQIINLLSDLQQKLGVAYLFISHNLAVVRHLAHRVAVMYLGRIVEIGKTEEVFSVPRHPYTQALLSAVPVSDPTRARSRIAIEGEPVSPIDIPSGCRFHTRCPYDLKVCREEDPPLSSRNSETKASCHKANEHPEYVQEAITALP